MAATIPVQAHEAVHDQISATIQAVDDLASMADSIRPQLHEPSYDDVHDAVRDEVHAAGPRFRGSHR
jgi:hypothetical protein